MILYIDVYLQQPAAFQINVVRQRTKNALDMCVYTLSFPL